MEDVLALYAAPADPKRPLVCLDEFCKQLIGDKSAPLPTAPGHPARYDYEYVRHGCASAFMIFAPFEGVREIFITEEARRTRLDYARALEFIATEMFAEAEKIILVEDNLNTHEDASLYAAFEPAKARAIAERIERHHTPKHGSWLNISESEIAAVLTSSIDERIASQDEFRRQCQQAQVRRNQQQLTTDWRFTNNDARIKLSSLYPAYQC